MLVTVVVVGEVYGLMAKLSYFNSRQKTFLHQLTFYAWKENGLVSVVTFGQSDTLRIYHFLY